MNTDRPEVSEEHLKSMAEYYGTIGEMTRSDFDKKIVLELSSLLSKQNGLWSGIKLDIRDNYIEKLFGNRNSDCDCVSVGKKGLTMNIEFPNIFFKTSDGKDIEHLEKYLAQNSISQDEFKESVLNAIYINLKTPFCVNELGITTNKTRELANGVLEASSDTKPDDKLLEEDLREKKNREILSRVLETRYPANTIPFVMSDKLIDEIQATFILNEEGKKMCRESGDLLLMSLAPHNSPVTLNIKTFLQKFDLDKIYDYTNTIGFNLINFEDKIYINTADFLQTINKTN